MNGNKVGLLATGVPSREELAECPGYPSFARMMEGRVAVIECFQRIPCNPCVAACKWGAISKDSLVDLPRLESDKCTGCAQCVAACPGQAIFVVDMPAGEVTLPYEFLPLPEKGDMVKCLGRDGVVIQDGEVLRVTLTKRNVQTAVVTVSVEPSVCEEVRAIRMK